MPALKNPKHELFAQALAKGMSQVDAYEAAGYKPNRQHASRLVTKGDIKRRIREISAPVLQKTQLTKERIIEGLFEHRAIALAQPKPDLSAANRAYELLGKEIRMFADRTIHERKDADDLTTAELLEIIRQHRPGRVIDAQSEASEEEPDQVHRVLLFPLQDG